MKELNRREFLTLTGAAVVALSLAGCGGPSTPPAHPAAPTGKEAEDAKEPVHTLTTEDMQKLVRIQEWKISLEKKYDLGGAAGISEPTGEGAISLTFEYSCEDAVIQKFVNKIMGYSLSREAEFISVYCPVVQGKTYMIATVFWNKKA